MSNKIITLKYDSIKIGVPTPNNDRIYSKEIVDDMLKQYNEKIKNNMLYIDCIANYDNWLDVLATDAYATDAEKIFGKVLSVKYDDGFEFEVKIIDETNLGYAYYKVNSAWFELMNMADLTDSGKAIKNITIGKLSFIIKSEQGIKEGKNK